MNSYKIFFFSFYSCIFLCHIFIHSKSNENNLGSIRGFQFGEKRSFVTNQEKLKNDYFLIPSLTNTYRLTYQGVLFNKLVTITYLFRENRLTSLLYTWNLIDMNEEFHTYLKNLLNKKYGKPSLIEILSSDSKLEILSYTKYQYTKKTQIPILTIELEKITHIFENDHSTEGITNNTYILEFRPFDSDAIIQDKILSEDL